MNVASPYVAGAATNNSLSSLVECDAAIIPSSFPHIPPAPARDGRFNAQRTDCQHSRNNGGTNGEQSY